MCNCNKTPNMISVITKALQLKFPEHDIIVEELISSDINDFNNPRFLDTNIFASWFFGNLEVLHTNDFIRMTSQNFEVTSDQLHSMKDVLFSKLEPLDGGTSVPIENVPFQFYGWYIYLKDSILGGQIPVVLTPFSASEPTANGCDETIEPLTTTLYHNGTEALPQLGDTIFEDEAGTILFLPEFPATQHSYIGDGVSTISQNYICVDENSQRVEFECK